MAAYTASQVSISNGSKAVVINSNENPESVAKGDFLFLSGSDPKEINRTYINDQQKHVIELIENWDSGNKTNQPAIVLPTTVNFKATVDAIQNANLLINDNMQAMSDWQSKLGTVTFIGLDGTERTVPTLASFLATLGTAADTDKVVNSVDATAGRLTSVGWGGIGGARISKQAYGNDLLNLAAENNYNGWIVEVSVDTANKPPMGPNNLAGHVIRVQNTLLMIAGYPFSEEGNMYIGYWDGTTIDWYASYNSGNINLDEIRVTAAGQIIATGERFTSNLALFYIPQIAAERASGISVTGTYTITDGSTNVLATGITPSYQGTTSNSMLQLSVGNLNGAVTETGLLRLIADYADSKIKVNR